MASSVITHTGAQLIAHSIIATSTTLNTTMIGLKLHSNATLNAITQALSDSALDLDSLLIRRFHA